VIAEMADTVAVMYAGKIVEMASGDNLFDQPSHPYTIGLIRSVPKINEPVGPDRKLEAITGVVPSLLDLPIGCAFQERCKHAMDKCQTDPPTFSVSDTHQVRCWLHES
jgi:oligopeptide/dipeptide ABC transporter ATP-binding protein